MVHISKFAAFMYITGTYGTSYLYITGTYGMSYLCITGTYGMSYLATLLLSNCVALLQ